jgi:hypothetical protein
MVLLAGCAAPSVFPGTDASVVGDGGPRGADLARRSGDGAGPCTLGTTDDCGTCGNACPGADDAQTMRLCTAATAFGTCDITCKGESYDVNGKIDDGCEAEDLPVQDSPAAAVAVSLPNVAGTATTCDSALDTNTHNPCTVVGQIFSDSRQHDAPPTTRMNGREDWYKVSALGAGSSSTMTACLGIGNYSSDNMYSVCISDNGLQTPSHCMTVTGGGASQCVQPTGSPSSGTFYIQVKKLAGSPTALGYALYLDH